MENYVMPLLLAIIGSGSVFGFIQYLISRKDNKSNNKVDELEKKIDSLARSSCRTEMLVMMNHYSDEVMEIMRLSRIYFDELHGDFYMTSLFAKWLDEHNLECPNWFDRRK